jgi:hypothetical protein
MDVDVYFYRGLYKAKVVTKSEGYWIIEALEDFDDFDQERKVKVKTGEQKIVEPGTLHKKKFLSPPYPEHVYERKLEQEVKRMVENHEKTKK